MSLVTDRCRFKGFSRRDRNVLAFLYQNSSSEINLSCQNKVKIECRRDNTVTIFACDVTFLSLHNII